MASLRYLWSNRIQFSVVDVRFFRAWAKRVLTLKELIYRVISRRRLIRAGAVISTTAEIGKIKFDGTKKKLKVGDFTFIGRVELALHADIRIGDRVCINDGVIILTATHNLNDVEWNHQKKAVIIEDYAWICTNAIILPGVSIGRGAVIGAGAVVSKNVAPFEIVVGNPAKPLSKRRVSNLDYNPCEFVAANRAWLKG